VHKPGRQIKPNVKTKSAMKPMQEAKQAINDEQADA